MTKLTTGMFFAIFLISFFTAGFFPALLLTSLALGATVTGSINTENRLTGGKSHKELW